MDFTLGQALKAMFLGYLAISGRVLGSSLNKYSPSGINGGDVDATDATINALSIVNFENYNSPYFEAQVPDTDDKSSWYRWVAGAASWIRDPDSIAINPKRLQILKCDDDTETSPRSFTLVMSVNEADLDSACRLAALDISGKHAEAALTGSLRAKQYEENPSYRCRTSKPLTRGDCTRIGSLKEINGSSTKKRNILLSGYITTNCFTCNRRNGKVLIINFFIPITAFKVLSPVEVTRAINIDKACEFAADHETSLSDS